MRTRSFRATLVLGIDGLQRPLDAPAGAASGDHRPPYDVERILGFEGFGDSLRPIFAVAGFAPEQLEITVLGDQLFLSGEQSGDVDPQRCLYRAIAARRFRRVFRLAGSLGVERAAPSDGLLSIDLRERGQRRECRTMRSGCGAVESAAPGRCLRDRNA